MLADRPLRCSEPRGALSQSQQCSGQRRFVSVLCHGRCGPVTHGVASDGSLSLSFLGLGLQPPVISWGVLLQEAQNTRSVSSSPWLLLPALGVIVTVLSLNFFGDGLRDAADPYGR